jgi:WD40 repeat protein/tetratricopeptide (TPR) repeat protein/serine/threonine protein kinase
VCAEKNEEAIFNAAIEIDSPAERAEFVKSACGDDAELLARVEALLRVHYEDESFLKAPPAGARTTLDAGPLTEGPGTRIGRYKLLQLIGEGGFGVVYMAEQEKPIHRRVALKIIKLGMDTKQVIARFEAERQALAMMDHPNIARVLDAGATDTGRPYFVMELVKGVPVTEYCDKNNLDTRQRLELFIDVCKAVQHAHQKGIIHRDIKPSNVMITLHDGRPVPKIIDFGIAKATQHRLTEKTLFTEYRQFIGTPEYMSPEQAEMSGLDVDTRSDIYSLGVLLYELLTGTTPFEAEKLRSAAYDEIRRIIREDEPPRPSTRLSTLGESLTDIAKHRNAQPGELRRIVRGDLDWVVMKSLEKDRTRRYETANEFAMDIRRHLGDEPVVAGPPGAMYRIRKFVRRNRTKATAAAVMLAAIVVGLVVSITMYFQAEQAREYEATARTEAEQARRAEADQRQIAETERDRAVKAQQETQRANEKLIWENYIAAIGISQRFIKEGNIKDAKALLEKCPAEHRHWEWGHLQYLCNQDIRTVRADPREVLSIAFSANGKCVATVGALKSVKLWDTNMEQLLTEMPGTCFAISPDSEYLAIGSPSTKSESLESVNLWDMQAGRVFQTLEGHKGGVKAVAFSPDGKLIASVSSDGVARIWDVATGKERHKLLGPYYEAECVTFSPDGKYLAAGYHSWDVVLWDVETGKTVSMHKENNHEITALAFTPDGQYLYSSGAGNKVIRWNVHTDSVEQMHRSQVTVALSIAIDRDGKYLATGNSNMTVSLYDLKTNQEIHIFKGHTGEVDAVAFSPDGKYLTTGGKDGDVKFWDLERLQGHLRLKGHMGDIKAIAFSPDGRYLATGAGNWNMVNDHTVRIWDLESGSLLHDLTGHHLNIWCLAFSPDGATLATSSWDDSIKIWSVQTGEEMQTLKKDTHGVESLAFHPNGRYLASGNDDHSAKIWDLATGRKIRTLSGHTHWVSAVAYSPDGRLLATGSWDNRIKIWDIERGKVLRDLIHHSEMVQSLAFSSDGRLLASGSYDDTARIWQVSTGQQLTVLRGHTEMVGAVAFSPDDKRLFTASRNAVAKIWDVKTGRELLTFSSGMNRDPPLAVSPDGRLIAIAQGHDAVILPAFPWREEDYPGDSSMSLQERIELYKRDYWKQQAQKVQVKSIPFEQATPIQKEQILLERLMAQSRELGPEHPDTLNSLDRLLKLYKARGKWTVGLLEKLVAEFPDSPVLRSRLVTDLAKLGCELERLGYGGVDNAFSRAKYISKELLRLYTREVESNPKDAGAHLRRGNLYLIGLGQYDEAALDYSAAIELCRARGESTVELLDELVSDFPDSPDLRSRLAEGLTKLGDALKTAGHTDQAELAFSRAKAINNAVYKELLELYAREIETYPENAEAYARRGDFHWNTEQWDKALNDYSKAIELDPNQDHYRHWRAEIYWNMKQWDKALADFSKAIELNPGHSYHWHRRADTYSEMRQWDKALADFSQAVSLNPNESDHWHRRADVYSEMQQWDKALADFSKAIELNPDNSHHWHRRADTYSQIKQWDKALADYSKAIEVDPNNSYAWQGRGWLYSNMEQWDDAVANFSKAVELEPDAWSAWDGRFRAYLQLGQQEKALADYSSLIELRPQDAKVRVLRGDCYYHLKDYRRALEDYSAAIELDANFCEAWYSRGLAYAALGRPDKAALDFAKAVELGWDGAYYLYCQALAELGSGDLEKYRKTCATMLERFGQTENAVIAHWVAWTCVLAPDATGDLTRTMELAGLATESSDRTAQNLCALGAILYRAGRFDEAVEQLSNLTAEWEQGKEFPTLTSPAYTWFFLAMAHHQLGNTDQSQRYFESAVERAEEEIAGNTWWNRKLTLQLLQAEAAELLGVSEETVQKANEVDENK